MKTTIKKIVVAVLTVALAVSALTLCGCSESKLTDRYDGKTLTGEISELDGTNMTSASRSISALPSSGTPICR